MNMSKFLRVPMKQLLTASCRPSTLRIQTSRHFGENLIPPSQYDTPLSKKFNLMYVMTVYWETIPLFATTLAALLVLAFSIISACRNKVDVVFTTHSRDNISRTMDLRNPTVHKLITITQRYEPWPEMADVLDKMKTAEKRAMVRAQTCSFA